MTSPADPEPVTEYGVPMTNGDIKIRGAETIKWWPLADWAQEMRSRGTPVLRRRIIVVEDWAEVDGPAGLTP